MDVKQIEYLLNRKIIKLEGDLSYIKDKRILITGAGTIGTELCRQLLHNKAERLYLIDHSENALYNAVNVLKSDEDKIVPILGNLQNKDFVIHLTRELYADIIFHSAAHKHVDLCEENPVECIKNNVFGLRNLLTYNLLSSYHPLQKFILISTDKAVTPVGVYGLSKKICEDMVLGVKDDDFVVARFGNVLASSGSVFNLFENQIKNNLPITITDKRMSRFFMTQEEACSLLLQVGNIGEKNNIYVLKMGEIINMLDFANRMMDIIGNKVSIKYIGMRKGEKLIEELTNKDEVLFDTSIEGIKSLVGVNNPIDIDMKKLKEVCESRNKKNLLEVLKIE